VVAIDGALVCDDAAEAMQCSGSVLATTTGMVVAEERHRCGAELAGRGGAIDGAEGVRRGC
jgi:hypothetical protein